MNKRVKFSKFTKLITLLVLFLYALVVYISVERNQTLSIWIVSAVMALLFIGTLCFMPLRVSVNGKFLSIRRPLRTKKIKIEDIAVIERYSPSFDERRLLGSGGWFGYWGWFKDKGIGKYFAYYGKSGDCFYVGLKNGKQYVVGCDGPDEIVEYVKRQNSLE